MISYLNDFSIMVAPPSHWGNIRQVRRLFSTIAKTDRGICVFFSIPKTELIHWRTTSQRTLNSTALIELEGHCFHPSRMVRRLRYRFTPGLTSPHHCRHRVALARPSFLWPRACPRLGQASDTSYTIPWPMASSSQNLPTRRTTSPQTLLCSWGTNSFPHRGQ